MSKKAGVKNPLGNTTPPDPCPPQDIIKRFRRDVKCLKFFSAILMKLIYLTYLLSL
jgi:hypothetical protein